MTNRMWLRMVGIGLLACVGAVACAASDVDQDGVDEELGMQQSAQAKEDPPPSSKEGKGCTASSTIRNTTVSNGTYSSNGSGGYNCCSKPGPLQVCINCNGGAGKCEDKAKTTPWTPPVGPVPTVISPSP